MGLGQHFCSSWCGDDMPVRWDVAGQKISDELPEMEHLSFEVMHQSECHVLLDLSLATSLISREFACFFFAYCVLAQANQSCGDQGGREVRVMVKSLGFAHASPKKDDRARE